MFDKKKWNKYLSDVKYGERRRIYAESTELIFKLFGNFKNFKENN